MTTRIPGAVKGRPVGALGVKTSQERQQEAVRGRQAKVNLAARVLRFEEALAESGAFGFRERIELLERKVQVLEARIAGP